MISITLIEANAKIVERYGDAIQRIVPYEEDDGSIWYRFFYFDGIEETWDGYESVEEAFLSFIDYLG